MNKYDDIFETFYQEKIIDKIFTKCATALNKKEFVDAMSPSLLGDMFGAVGDLGGGIMGKIGVQADNSDESEMEVESNFTMGNGETDWLFSPNKIRNFVAFGVKLHKSQIEEEK